MVLPFIAYSRLRQTSSNMAHGRPQKRVYWAVVDRNLDVVPDEHGGILWVDHAEVMAWFYKNKMSESEYRIIRWTIMAKPEKWK